jgi:hypothetical protein
MKRLASRLTWWHTLPHKSTRAVNAAERRGQRVGDCVELTIEPAGQDFTSALASVVVPSVQK